MLCYDHERLEDPVFLRIVRTLTDLERQCSNLDIQIDRQKDRFRETGYFDASVLHKLYAQKEKIEKELAFWQAVYDTIRKA